MDDGPSNFAYLPSDRISLPERIFCEGSKMRKAKLNVILSPLAVAILAIMLMTTASAASGGHTYNAISTISNGDGTNTFVLQSDNQPGNAALSAAYSVNDPGVSNTVYLDFSKFGSPIPSGNYYATIRSGCFNTNNKGTSISFLSIAPGTALTSCSFRIQFHYNGSLYLLAMDPKGVGPQGAPPTGAAAVACNSDATDNSGCNNWTITPYSGGSNPGVVDLYVQEPSGLLGLIGSYSGYTFRVDLQR
jgi:hypothetical protein